METYKGPITRSRSKQLQNLEVGEFRKLRQKKFKRLAIEKKEEMKFLKIEKKEEMKFLKIEKDKESHGEGLEITHLTFLGNNISYLLFHKESYQYFQETE